MESVVAVHFWPIEAMESVVAVHFWPIEAMELVVAVHLWPIEAFGLVVAVHLWQIEALGLVVQLQRPENGVNGEPQAQTNIAKASNTQFLQITKLKALKL